MKQNQRKNGQVVKVSDRKGLGPFIKDVINQGGGRICQKMILLAYLVNKSNELMKKEGGGQKLMTSFMNGPISKICQSVRQIEELFIK